MTAVDLPPFGKNPPVGGADQDTDDEGKQMREHGFQFAKNDDQSLATVNNDDSEDSESHDEEEDEVEPNDANQGINGSNTITSDIASLE